MARGRKLTRKEFEEAIKLGGSRGKPVGRADFEHSKAIGEDVLLYDSSKKLVFNTTLMAISPEYSQAKKDIQRNMQEQTSRAFLTLGIIVVAILGFAGVNIAQRIDRHAESQKLEKERYRQARERYIKREIREPVAVYEYTNQVFDEIDSNQFRFKRDKNGKVVHILGYIAKGGIGNESVAIDGYGSVLPPKISCNVMPEFRSQLANISAGQTIMIAGKVDYSDTLWDDVDLNDCLFFTDVQQRGSMRLWDAVEPFFRY